MTSTQFDLTRLLEAQAGVYPDVLAQLRAGRESSHWMWFIFVERGYEQTTVADIAGHAGLTARTFFRHFADKREVLFDGSERLQWERVYGLPRKALSLGARGDQRLPCATFFPV